MKKKLKMYVIFRINLTVDGSGNRQTKHVEYDDLYIYFMLMRKSLKLLWIF